MTIIVIGPGTRDGKTGLRRGEERRILLGRTVVRNLEDIGSKVGLGAQNRLLARRFDVASEQQPEAGDRDHDHQAAVVLF